MATRENVFKAADDLDLKGERVSVRTVREVLGGGSYRDICGHLAKWRSARDARMRTAADKDAKAAASDLTPEAERVILNFLEGAWREALARAQERFDRERQSLTERADALQSMLDEALERAEAAEDAYERLVEAVGARLGSLPVMQSPERDKVLRAVWLQVRQIAEEIAARNGGSFTANEVAEALPSEIGEQLDAMGILPLTPQKIAGRFRLRRWFEPVKGGTFKLPEPSADEPAG